MLLSPYLDRPGCSVRARGPELARGAGGAGAEREGRGKVPNRAAGGVGREWEPDKSICAMLASGRRRLLKLSETRDGECGEYVRAAITYSTNSNSPTYIDIHREEATLGPACTSGLGRWWRSRPGCAGPASLSPESTTRGPLRS
jgi:hypothetical protein